MKGRGCVEHTFCMLSNCAISTCGSDPSPHMCYITCHLWVRLFPLSRSSHYHGEGQCKDWGLPLCSSDFGIEINNEGLHKVMRILRNC